MEKQLRGVITIKDGKVMHLKNATDPNVAVIGNGDPIHVLKALSDSGWKLYGDYELTMYRNVETQESRKSAYVTESKSAKSAVRAAVQGRKP